MITPEMLILVQDTAAAVPEPSTTVTIPWGEWIAGVVNVALPAVGTLLTGIVSYIVSVYVPPWLKAVTGARGQERVNQLIQKAVMSAVGQTKDAVLGKHLEISIANDVLRRAMQYAVDQAPDLIKAAARDNVDNLAKMVMARMTEIGLLPADFDVAQARKVTGAPVVNNQTGKPVVVPPKDFSFDDAISKGLGGH